MALVATVSVSPEAGADERVSGICNVAISVARFELEDIREDEELAASALTAEQGILDLLQPLWDARLTERLRYLQARHARDRAALMVARTAVARQRAEAKLEALESACDPIGSSSAGSGGRETGRDAGGTAAATLAAQGGGKADAAPPSERFESLGCDLVGHDRRIAEIDLDFFEEVLHSTNELRSRDLATIQEVIVATYDVKNAKSALALRTRRREACHARTSR